MLRDNLHGSLEACSDQRGAERHVLRLTAAIDARPEHPITIHNLSRTGLLVASDSTLAKGDRIDVELVGGVRHGAEVVWADDRLFGCRFAEPLSRGSLSAALLRAEPATRAPSDDKHTSHARLPASPASDALSVRMKVAIIGTMATACWACLAGTTYLFMR